MSQLTKYRVRVGLLNKRNAVADTIPLFTLQSFTSSAVHAGAF